MQLNFLKKHAGVSALEVYTGLLVRRIQNGNHDKKFKLSDDQLQIEYQRVYTGRSISCYFVIQTFAKFVPETLFGEIRAACASTTVRVEAISHNFPHEIDWSSSKMRYRQNLWESDLDAYESTQQARLRSSESIQVSKRARWLQESWMYLKDMTGEQKHSLVVTDFIIRLVTTDNTPACSEDLKSACAKFWKYCTQHHIGCQQVRGYIYDLLKYCSPFYSMTDEKEVKHSKSYRNVSKRVIATETFASLETYSEGLVSRTGVLMGVNIFTGQPVYHDYSASTGAQDLMIAGSAGDGKSAFVKALLLSALASNYATTVFDRTGEYIAETEAVKGQQVNFSKTSGNYFDSMQIGNITGVESVDAGLFTEARVYTAMIFDVLCNITTGMSPEERAIFTDAYNQLLARFKVKESDRSTWVRSKNLTYPLLFQRIAQLSEDPAYIKRYGDVIGKMVRTLSSYFDESGLRSYMFRHPVRVEDILHDNDNLHSKMLDSVVTSGGSTTVTTESNMEYVIKHISSIQLQSSVVNYNLSKHLQTITVFEEANQYNDETDAIMMRAVTEMFTNNRKRNATTILVTNNPRTITSGTNDVSKAILSNAQNSIILGKLDTQSIKAICENFDMEDCQSVLHDISVNEKLKHCFLFKQNGGNYTIIKAMIDNELAESSIFHTRDVGNSSLSETRADKVNSDAKS